MTTTAFDDQYLAAPDPVREPMSREAILRRNIADMEVALRTQTERAASAEAELAKLRSQEAAAWAWDYCGINVRYQKEKPDFLDGSCAYWPLYAAPVPAPAVPEEWRDFAQKAKWYFDGTPVCNNTALSVMASALLQSSEVPK